MSFRALHQKHRPLETVNVDAVETEETIVKMEDAARRLASALTTGTSHLDIVSIDKITPARELFEDPRIDGHFPVRAWVGVSPQFERKRVFVEILAVIYDTSSEAVEAMNMSEVDLVEFVYRSLKSQRYLIVLDDVWSDDYWLRLRMAFPDACNGSRVLITITRKDTVTTTSELFKRKLNLDETYINPETELEVLARKIARLCGGLPFSVKGMANLLSTRPLNQWRELVEKFIVDGLPTEDLVLSLIGSSYDNLPFSLKKCLLYLGNFPKDTAIECDTVCQLWIAEGLISMRHGRHGRTMMDVAADYLDALAKRSLVRITEDKYSRQRRFKSCSIHDVTREFCKTKGKHDRFFEVVHLANENQNMSSSIIRRAVHLDKYEYTHSQLYGNADYFRSLLFFTSNQSEEGIIRPQEIPNLGHFNWLRVLYLYGVKFTDGKLPKGVEKLVYLRYLSFRECHLEEFSSLVGNMLFLQTLDLRVRNECEMTITDVFHSLKSLKYLYFPLAYRTLDHEKLHLGNLDELEILDNFDTSLCDAEDLRGLINLQELTITTGGDQIERIFNALENDTSRFRSISFNIRNFDCLSRRRISTMEKVFKSSALHVLEVEGYLGKFPEFDRTSSKLTEVMLNGSQLVEDPMQILQELPMLTILVLEIEAYNGKNMNCSSSGFRELRYLKLLQLYELKDWIVEVGAMPSLRTLVIENCKNLKMLPDGLKYCKELQKLEIASMKDAFVGRIQTSDDGTEGEDFHKIKHVQPNVKIDGQHLILKEKQQGPREDPQSSSMH